MLDLFDLPVIETQRWRSSPFPNVHIVRLLDRLALPREDVVPLLLPLPQQSQNRVRRAPQLSPPILIPERAIHYPLIRIGSVLPHHGGDRTRPHDPGRHLVEDEEFGASLLRGGQCVEGGDEETLSVLVEFEWPVGQVGVEERRQPFGGGEVGSVGLGVRMIGDEDGRECGGDESVEDEEEDGRGETEDDEAPGDGQFEGRWERDVEAHLEGRGSFSGGGSEMRCGSLGVLCSIQCCCCGVDDTGNRREKMGV